MNNPTSDKTTGRPVRCIAYDFPLRHLASQVVIAQLVLPQDLTKMEADRLCAMIQTLAIPEAKR